MKHIYSSSFLAAAIISQLSFASPLGRREEIEEEGGACEIEIITTLIAVTAALPESTTSTSSSSISAVVQVPTNVVASSPTPATVESTPSTPIVSTYITPDVPSSSEPATPASSSAVKTSTATGLTPSGTKAGLSGFIGVQNKSGFSDLAEYISWYSDYSATTPDSGNVQGIPMVWGSSSSCGNTGSSRMSEFEAMTTTPKIMFGFFEPDCDCPMSSDMSDPAVGAAAWNTLLAPLAAKGTTLGSPSMCKQKDEDWLTPFSENLDVHWDVTSIHINKNSLAGVKEDVEYYVSKYAKPVWVSEFACVDDENEFVACSDQGAIDSFLNEVVPYLENNENVVAYGPSNGEGLGNTWPLFNSNGDLSATGQTYLNILKGL